MVCSNCNSTDLRKLSLIYAEGSYASTGRIGGISLGEVVSFHFGRYRGRNQSKLSALAGPPRKRSYVAPTIVWLVGFFIVMPFAGRGKLSDTMGLFCVAYLFLLPILVIGTLAYNLFAYPRRRKSWALKFMCLRCGAISPIEHLRP